jgi:hypothetical protein
MRVLANGGLLEIHLGACEEAFVDFMFAAIVNFRVGRLIALAKRLKL